jgi:hypothetical protein
MKKNTLIFTIACASILTGMFLWTKFHTPTGPIPLRLLKEEDRHRTVERTLTKKTEFESQNYIEEYKVTLECTFEEKHYEYASYLAYVVAICNDKSDAIYTPLSRETVQTCIAQREGFTHKIVPITGMTLEDEGSFMVVPGEGACTSKLEERSSDIFYLNIPIDMVQFLNKIEATLRTDVLMRESISQEDIIQYNLINALIHGGLRIITEMDPVKPHVCAYRLKSLEDVDVEYDVKEEELK